MQLKKILVTIPFLTMALISCIKDDLSDCTSAYNLEFIFEYTDEPGTPFTDLIKTVDLLLYDVDSCFLQHRRITETNLTTFRGMRLSLAPGKYYVVAWANVGAHSTFSDYTNETKLFSQCYLQIAEQANDGVDPIYYAPRSKTRSGEISTQIESELYEVIVLPDQTTIKQLDFVRAYRTINVWINGYERSDIGEDIPPIVNAKKLWSKYNFYLEPLNLRRDFRQQAHEEKRSDHQYSVASFRSVLGEINGYTDIDINRTSDNKLSHTLNLKQFVQDNNITNTEKIDILITFTNDLSVSISIPPWETTPVWPGVR